MIKQLLVVFSPKHESFGGKFNKSFIVNCSFHKFISFIKVEMVQEHNVLNIHFNY